MDIGTSAAGLEVSSIDVDGLLSKQRAVASPGRTGYWLRVRCTHELCCVRPVIEG